MKKIIKGIWKVSCYPLLYIVMQVIASFLCTFVAGVVVGVQNAERITTMTQQEITEMVMANFNIQIPLLVNAILVFFIMYLILRKSWKQTGFWKGGRLKVTSALLCIILGAGLNSFTIGAINLTQLTDLFPTYKNLMGSMMGDNLVLQIICIAIVVPFLEEIIFRGIVFGRLRNMTKLPVALVLQAAIFGLIHLNVLQGAYAFIVGIVLGLVCLWLDSIWAAVAAHIAYNMTSVVVVSLVGDMDMPVMGLVVMMLVGVVVAVVALVVCGKSKRRSAIEQVVTAEV